jgi:hypothetical protein
VAGPFRFVRHLGGKEDEMRPIGFAALAVLAAMAAPGADAQTVIQTQSGPPVIMPQVVTAPPVIIVAPTAPPAPQTEAIPVPPSGQEKVMVWQPGRWAWVNGAWSWQVGQYVLRPSETSTWIPGRWELQPNGGYMWIEGRWG